MSLHQPLTQSDAASSLLSLSIAAASAVPIPLAEPSTSVGSVGSVGVHGSLNANHTASVPLSTSVGSGVKQHRRLASTGKARRRLSDARDAANRPSPSVVQNAAALSLASLSLSSSPPIGSAPPVSTSFTSVSNTLNNTTGLPANGTSVLSTMPLNDGVNIPPHPVGMVEGSKNGSATPIPISSGKNGRKRGMDHKCESCSKIYRHPSCLIKHRWEHTPHWREASKFVLSKHQQVQLLEAAAILSHLSPSSSTGTSLPDDRSLWPSFLSGGSLPKVDGSIPTTNPSSVGIPNTSNPANFSYPSHPVSSSVPATNGGNFHRSTSTGPRLHDYSVPASTTGSGGITQLRPGLLGVPTGPTAIVASTPSMPVPVPNNAHGTSDSFSEYRSATSDPWASSPYENGNVISSYAPTSISAGSYTNSDERSLGTGAGGWSLPRSSLRSVSASSRSRSRSGSASGSRSDEESVDVDVDGDLDDYSSSGYGGRYGLSSRSRKGMAWKREEDELSIGFSVREEDEGDDDVVIGGPTGNQKEVEWDGLEMEMDMD